MERLGSSASCFLGAARPSQSRVWVERRDAARGPGAWCGPGLVSGLHCAAALAASTMLAVAWPIARSVKIDVSNHSR